MAAPKMDADEIDTDVALVRRLLAGRFPTARLARTIEAPQPGPIQARRRKEWLVTKQEFVDQIASKTDLSRRDAAKAVDAVLGTITETLKSGGDVTFTGFGKFRTAHRTERQGVNPRDPSQKVTIPAARVPRFSAGSSLKQAVRG